MIIFNYLYQFGAMGWPFSGSQSQEELKARLKRRCGRTYSALQSCIKANETEKPCKNLRDRLVHCQAEVLCPKESQQYSACVVRVDSTNEPYSACDSYMKKMEACVYSRKNKKIILG